MTSKHMAPKHTLTDDFFPVCNWKGCILTEEFISCFSLANELSLLSVLLKLYRSGVCLKEAYWSNLASALSSEEITHSISYVEVSSPATGPAQRPGCLLLSVHLSAPGDPLQAGQLARATVGGWVTWNVFPCIICACWGADLQIEHLSYDRYHRVISFMAESLCVHVTSKMQLFLLWDQSFLLSLG